MRLRKTELFGATAITGGALVLFACSGGEDYPPFPSGTGGATSTTANTGGTAPTGGTLSTGGTSSTGGVAPTTGGFNTGGATGGSSTGGATGGSIFGNTGGASTGGKGGFGNTGGKSGTGGKGGFGTTGGNLGTGGNVGTGGKGGSTGGSSAGGSGSVAFSQVASYVRSKCGVCHSGTRTPTLNSTDNAALYNTLTSTTVSRCGSNKLAVAGDPSKSALLMLSTGQCTGLRMPQGCTSTAQCISSADQTLLTNWIQAGAKNP